MDLGLRGKVALVTGASAGIGRAVARELAAEGARVFVASRDRGRIESAAHEVAHSTRSEVTPLVADVSRPGEASRIVEEVVGAAGALHVLVTNAGGPRSGNFDDVDEEDFSAAIELTFRSAERLVRAAIPHLRANGWGRIVHLTSITAKEPHDGLVLSNALRPAVHGLAKSLSRGLAKDGITVNCVCTGFTETERLGELAAAAAARRGLAEEEIWAAWRGSVPRGRLGSPDEVAAVVAFLCSDRASYVNGVSLAVDGGESHSLL